MIFFAGHIKFSNKGISEVDEQELVSVSSGFGSRDVPSNQKSREPLWVRTPGDMETPYHIVDLVSPGQ